MTIHTDNNKGSMLILSLVATGLFLVMLIGSIGFTLLQQKLNIQKVARAQAFQIAESGVNYYRWALYHDNDDYCNQETCLSGPDYGPYGPYLYEDSAGQNIEGYYELYITPPPINGSTIVNIKSIGWTSSNPNIKRTIEVQCGIPAWSSYSTLANANIRFGAGTEVWGRLHSNGGIRFDGLAHDVVTSALLDYDDPDHNEPGPDPHEFGVHTHEGTVDPLPDGNNPPENVPDRSDIFMAGRSFPVPAVSFDLLDSYVTEALNFAEHGGVLLGASGDEGYHLTLKANNDIDIWIVNDVTPECKKWGHKAETDGIDTETFLMTTTTPENGIVFIKDNVWIDGIIDDNRITILAFDEPLGGTVSDININNDILYTNYDGTDAIGLIAQRNIDIGLFSEDDLQIDAALIAKEGRVGRNFFYNKDTNGCSTVFRNRSVITVNGAIATRERYGFAWSDGSGYTTRNLNYDNNLTYSPPPHYPSTGEYTFISWEEK